MSEGSIGSALGTLGHRPLTDEHIGAQMMESVTKGQYTEPLHSLREYFANGLDAGADQIRIRHTAKSVIIHDNGHGMDDAELDDARGVGLSLKDDDEIGFRGIGVYSGFPVCDRILITSKKAGSGIANRLEIDVAGMRATLKKLKEHKPKQRFALKTLIYEHTLIGPWAEYPEELSFTQVQLENIDQLLSERLADRGVVRNYVLRNLVVDFDPSFQFRKEINDWLACFVPNYRPVVITLDGDTEKPETVYRPMDADLDRPTMKVIKGKKGEPICCIWACMTHAGKKIQQADGVYPGFTYKLKRVTLGDNQLLHPKFKKYGNGGLYWWFAGEIHIVGKGIQPNTARDNLEGGPEKDELDERVSRELEALEQNALEFQELNRAREVVRKRKEKLAKVSSLIDNWLNSRGGARIRFDLEKRHSELTDIITALKAQRSKASDKDEVAGLIKQAQDLQSVLIRQQRETTQPELPLSPKTDSKPGPNVGSRTPPARANGSADTITTDDTDTDEPEPTLAQVFEESGWEVTPQLLTALDLVHAALSDVLGRKSAVYRSILAKVEAKLAWTRDEVNGRL